MPEQTLPKVALIVIATGERYWRYIDPLIISAHYYFLPHDVVLFTDNDRREYGVRLQFTADALGYPQQTLMRYHVILDYANFLAPYSHLFYIDVDALFVAPVGAEILGEGITATMHAGFRPGTGDWETRYESTACVRPYKQLRYYCGGFNGGSCEAYLEMARVIKRNVDLDAKNGIMAMWHDESHLNRYLADHPPAVVLGKEYGLAEPHRFTRPDPMEVLRHVETLRASGLSEKEIWNREPCEPKILFLEKRWRT